MNILFPQKSEVQNTNPVKQDAAISDHVEKMEESSGSIMSVENNDTKMKKILLAVINCL